MKKWIAYGVTAVMMAVAVTLTVFAPDWLSRVVVGIMAGTIFVSVVIGIWQLIQYCRGFDNAISNIKRAQELQPAMPWIAVAKTENFFGQNLLDSLFEEYKRKVEVERKNGMIIGGIDEAINEDELSLRSWQGIMVQIPGTLTGLGLLGTFIGLITGINSIQISSLDATLASIQNMFQSIEVAFYTSICGVILSVVFNIIYKILWNIMLRDMGMFISSFQRNVIPSVEEQSRYSQKRDMDEIRESLNRLPQKESFSLSNTDHTYSNNSGSESILMPQILAGMQKKEFTCYLQPRYDLNTNKIVGAEALVRWNHAKLGMVAPSVFIPMLENNGYITKLDQYIWDLICGKIREWIDDGIHPVPISVNISKTDILALDVFEIFSNLIQKYRISPRYIEFDIAQNAYLEAGNIVAEFERKAHEKGFKIVVDGFRGDFFALRSGNTEPMADAYKLDLRFCKEENIASVAGQAMELRIPLVAEGIESVKQMAMLRKNGISEGQGFYLSKSIPMDKFEAMMNWRDAV